MPNTGTISGTVYKPDGKTPAAGVMVWLDFNGDGLQEPAGEYGTKTDANGAYVFGQLPKGVYPVAVAGGSAAAYYVIGQPSYSDANFTLPTPAAPTPPATTTTAVPLATPTPTPTTTVPPTSTAGLPRVPTLASGQTYRLDAGKTYVGPLVFNGLSNVVVDGQGATILCPNDGNGNTDIAVKFWYNSTNCTLKNVLLSSVDGQGTGCYVRGTGNTLAGVDFGNLAEGIDGDGLTNLTITGGRQLGAVQGRCLYLAGCTGLTWSGSRYGPASSQSPVRFSAPGVTNGTVTDVVVTQVGSPFPIATWALHCAHNVTFTRCQGIGGNLSLDGAGDAGAADEVADCTFADLTMTAARIEIKGIGKRCAFVRPVVTVDADWAVTVIGPTGCTFAGGKLAARGGLNFYGATSDLIVTDTTLTPTVAGASMFLGQSAAGNDGGGNVTAPFTPVATPAAPPSGGRP